MFADLLDECDRWYRAWFEKDAATVQRLMAEDYLYVGASGWVMDREAILAVIRSPTYRLDEGTRSEIVVRGVGQGAAIVRHRWQGAGSYEGTSFSDDNRSVMVWEKQGSQWRLVMDQCSFGGEGSKREEGK
jgi:ketosteroid isomerase-like protein